MLQKFKRQKATGNAPDVDLDFGAAAARVAHTLEPAEYRKLAKSLAANRAAREGFIQHFIGELRGKLEAAGIHARVFGRPKHLYSIHHKMERKDLPLEALYDLHAVRVIVADAPSCYTVLSLVHGEWLHIPAEFDDYIANPKPNGYQSLHTVVVGPEGRPVEIQIRTEDMHSFAEYGVAAHWPPRTRRNLAKRTDHFTGKGARLTSGIRRGTGPCFFVSI